jgi:hypothetical protein
LCAAQAGTAFCKGIVVWKKGKGARRLESALATAQPFALLRYLGSRISIRRLKLSAVLPTALPGEPRFAPPRGVRACSNGQSDLLCFIAALGGAFAGAPRFMGLVGNDLA